MRDSTRLKEQLLRRRRLASYPRRSEAVFTDENEHNPFILEECRVCGGHGTRCVEESAAVYATEECSECDGSGLTGEVVRYFPDAGSSVEALVDASGWVACPKCEMRFALKDAARWSGRRHLTCGQEIRLK